MIFCCFKQKTAYEMRISDWSSDVCSSDLLTYNAELRAERTERAGSIVDADVQRYRRFTGPALAEAGLEPLPDFSSAEIASKPRHWRILKQRGKRLTVLRIAKARITFRGGLDSLARKINRHTGNELFMKTLKRRSP